ncbi:MAG TPA: hypothetical protein DCX07_10575, partial [Phycisphaerales bacterium]|nr:hypothetical protein [Phycisphaerales bacterium]
MNKLRIPPDPRLPCSSPPPQRRGFTLIELLV